MWLAHAFLPLPRRDLSPAEGDIHFNTDYNWSCDFTDWDIGVVALHEIGHSIGLEHTSIREATMRAFITHSTAQLHQDDIDGAVSIYGARPAPPAPLLNTTQPSGYINLIPSLQLLFEGD